MNNIIAKIRLNSGQGGFWDPISRIHLTAGNPERDVEAGTNCTGLRAAVRSKRIKLVSGSLGTEVPPFKLVQRNGKTVLVPNVPVQKVERIDKPKKQAVKKKEVSAVKDQAVLEKPVKESKPVQEVVQESIPEQEPVIEQEPVEQPVAQEEVTPQETLVEAVSDETIEEISEGLDQLEEQLDQAEQDQSDQPKKKKKKKK